MLSSKSTKIVDWPLVEVERRTSTSSIPSSTSSNGSVISCSTFSADAPGQRVVTAHVMIVNSGSSRRGIVKKESSPQATSSMTTVITMVL